MIRVFMASGQMLTALPAEELSDASSLKQRLAGLCGVARFWQRLLLDGQNLDDWAKLDRPMDLQLVLLPYSAGTKKQIADLWTALGRGLDDEVEEVFREALLHPDSKQESGGDTPLCHAVRCNMVSMVHLLLEANADKHKASGRRNETPLNIACFKGHEDIVQVLLEARTEPNKASPKGERPLGLASFKGHMEIVQSLLAARADKDGTGAQGATPLLEAATRGHVAMATLLLEARAEVDKICGSDDMSYGETPLFVAARAGNTEVARLLLRYRANTDAICGLHGLTPLDVALRRGRGETWFLLAEAETGPSKIVGCCLKLTRHLTRYLTGWVCGRGVKAKFH